MNNDASPDKKETKIDKTTKQTIEKLSAIELKKEVKKDSYLISNHKIKK